MGLIEYAAVVLAVPILSQITYSHCMPRNHTNFLLKNYNKGIKSSDNRRSIKNESLGNKSTVINNNSGIIRFPNVDYPLDFDQAQYYRFLNDYTVQYTHKEYIKNNSSQVPTKHKRKFDAGKNTRAKPEISEDPEPQTYCFRKSNYFPDVEYPLSARDMWIPKYWSRLKDAKRNGYEETTRQIVQNPDKNTVFSNNNSDYESSALNLLIKSLNKKKSRVPDMSDDDINDELFIPQEGNGIVNEAILDTYNYDLLSKNISTDFIPVTIPPTEPISSTNIFTPLDDSFSSTTASLINSDVNEGTTAAPFEYITPPMSHTKPSIYEPEINCMTSKTFASDRVLTTDSPVLLTSCLLTMSDRDNVSVIEASDYPLSTFDFEQANFTNDWTLNLNETYTTNQSPSGYCDDWFIYVDTENSLPSQGNFANLTGDENILCSYCDTWEEKYLTGENVNSTLLIDIPTSNITQNTIQGVTEKQYEHVNSEIENNVNEEQISKAKDTKDLYECCEVLNSMSEFDSIIEANNTLEPISKSKGTMNLNVYCENSNSTVPDNDSVIGSTINDESMDQVLYFEDSNFTLQYEYIDDTSDLCTEMPYDLVLYPDYDNDTESAFVNNSVLLI